MEKTRTLRILEKIAFHFKREYNFRGRTSRTSGLINALRDIQVMCEDSCAMYEFVASFRRFLERM